MCSCVLLKSLKSKYPNTNFKLVKQDNLNVILYDNENLEFNKSFNEFLVSVAYISCDKKFCLNLSVEYDDFNEMATCEDFKCDMCKNMN